MTYALFDYVKENGDNDFRLWTEGLQIKERAKLNEKLDKLATYGDELYPHLLTDTDVPGIQKLRVKGNVQLRPLLCRGPVFVGKEYTLLFGAKEVGGKLQPANAPTKAGDRKAQVKANPQSRRKLHERVT